MRSSDNPYTRRILSHRTASPHALFDVLVLDGGRGKTMNDLVDRDRELPANTANLNKTGLTYRKGWRLDGVPF